MAGVNTSSGSINKNSPSPQTGTALAEGDTKLVIQAATWPPLPPFNKGEAPTLLDAKEAQKVKMFIENFLLNFTGILRTGSPEQNKFEWVFNPWGNNLDLWVQTNLIHDGSPQLGGNLDVNRRDIFSRDEPLYLDARGGMPVFIVGVDGYPGELRFGGVGRNTYVGFQAGSAPGNVIWKLPNVDGSNGHVLTTNGSGVLTWATAGGGGGSMTFDFEDEDLNAFSVSDSDTVSLTSDDGSVTIDCSVSGVIDFAASGGGGGSGTVTSVATSNGTFINITGGTITTTGTITGDLSATGSASSSTYLRGDNVWATIAAGGTVTSVTVDGGTGLTDTGSPITGSGTITLNLDNTAVTPATYGDATHVARIVIDQQGRITGASEVSISGGGGGSMSTWILSDGATSQTIENGNTVVVSGGTALTSTVSVTDTVTLNLDNTAVTPATYGDASNVARITIDQQGRITGASEVSISGGGGGMTSFDVEADGGNSFTVTNGESITFKSGGTPPDDYALQLAVDSAAQTVDYYLPYTPMGIFYVSDESASIPMTEGDTINFTSSDDSITWEAVTGGMDAIVANGPPPPSDRRLKKNIKSVSGSLEKVDKLRPVSFDWKKKAASEFRKEGHAIGLIADEVEQVLPDLVGERKGFSTVNYEELIPLLIDCVKDLSDQVKDLTARLECLEK